MYYFDMKHLTKSSSVKGGKLVRAPSAENRFYYITRTAHYQHQKSDIETVELVKSGNMPSWAQQQPAKFWSAADQYERAAGRTATTLVIALPKELSKTQRIELANAFIEQFADRYSFPYSCAIHHHRGLIEGIDQPHLHFMYSERQQDDIERHAEQFFKRYNRNEPSKGGCQKLTADVLGMGQAQVRLYREETEQLINSSLAQHAPTKKIIICGLEVEVPSAVSCLSHQDYNAKHGTNLKDVPMIDSWILNAKPDSPHFARRGVAIEEVASLRAHNNLEMYRPYYDKALHEQTLKDQPRHTPPKPSGGSDFGM